MTTSLALKVREETDFTAVAHPASIAAVPARREAWAEHCLERTFAPDSGTLASFLINALYLVGNHRILAVGDLDPGVTGELTRMGHRVDAGGAAAPRAAAGGRHDRAVAAARALGYGGNAETLAWLRNMRKTLAPGGLLAFHVFDRDRAWSLVGDRAMSGDGDGGSLRARVGFDPATGRLSARIARNDRMRGNAGPGAALPAGGLELSVRAYNLLEIRGLVESAGLALERAYGDWEGRGPEEGGARTGRLIVVASKPRVRPRPGSRGRPAPARRD